MTSLKGTILGCITFLVTVGVVITYFSQQDRYALYTHEKGIFVFDRKTATLNFCDSQICQMIRPVLPLQEPDVVMNGMSGMPSQNSIVNGSIPMSAPAITPQGAMGQPMMQAYQSVPQAMAQQAGVVSVPQQQTPIQIVSPLATPKAAAPAAPSTDKKSDKDSKPAKDKAAKTDDKKPDSTSDDNKDDDSTDDSSDTTETDDASDSSTDDSSESEDE